MHKVVEGLRSPRRWAPRDDNVLAGGPGHCQGVDLRAGGLGGRGDGQLEDGLMGGWVIRSRWAQGRLPGEKVYSGREKHNLFVDKGLYS